MADGAAGTSLVDQPDLLTDEDRILVALARRGDLPMATFIESAVFTDWIERPASKSASTPLMHFLDLDDDEFASVLERHADDLEAVLRAPVLS